MGRRDTALESKNVENRRRLHLGAIEHGGLEAGNTDEAGTG
jgi:hypothetical protein